MKLWIARDYTGSLNLYAEKPIKGTVCYYNVDDAMALNEDMFPEVTFENSPQEVELKLVSDKFDNPLLGALTTFGAEHQRMMCIEECGELIDALAKYDRGRADTKDVITELADVCIMVEQMAEFFGREAYGAERERKMMRLREIIEREKK